MGESPIASGLKFPRLTAAVAAGFALLILVGVASVIVSTMAADAEGWVAHTLEVRRLNQALFARVQDATLAERGYLITRDGRYLARFAAAKADVGRLERRLGDLVRDNPETQARVSRLGLASRVQLTDLDQTIRLFDQGQAAAAQAAVREHLIANHLGQAEAASQAVDQGEVRLLAKREAVLSGRRTLLVAVAVAAVIIILLLGGIVLRALSGQLAELARRNAALAEEIRRREETEGQLRQVQKMESIGQLTGGVAHDFNNMLAIIVGNLDLLSQRLDGADQRQRHHVEQALEGAQRAARLTRSLLAFSRQQPLDPTSLDVNRSVSAMSRILHRTLGETIHIETVLGAGLWPALVDQAQLESAILNLAINARDAMPSGGQLTLETANTYLDEDYIRADPSLRPGQYVLIAITDTGSGMPAEVIEKAFDPFFSTKPPGQGTGLGLSQVHGFIKQSGGHVKIYSEPGNGTAVKLYLPRSHEPASDADKPGESPPDPAPSGATILVAEDEQGVRDFVCGALQDLGYRPLSADNGANALAVLGDHPEVVALLTDVVMPDMSGRVLSDRALELRPDLKVLFMTGYTRNAIVHNGVLDSDARLITKPFTLAVLGRRLREVLAG